MPSITSAASSSVTFESPHASGARNASVQADRGRNRVRVPGGVQNDPPGPPLAASALERRSASVRHRPRDAKTRARPPRLPQEPAGDYAVPNQPDLALPG